jgi:hypothetical protein
MDNESAKIIGFFVTYVVGGFILGVMASRKNRDYMAWGLVGGLLWLPCIIALALLPPLCPKCHRPLLAREWRRQVCPTCGSVANRAQITDDAYVMLEKATNLELQGNVRQALVAYKEVGEAFPGTSAANDALKSLENLRERIG